MLKIKFLNRNIKIEPSEEKVGFWVYVWALALKLWEAIKTLIEIFFLLLFFAVFVYMHICWLQHAQSWGSPIVVGILQIIVLIVLFRTVRVRVFKELTNMIKGRNNNSKNDDKDKDEENEEDDKKEKPTK